MTQPSVTLNDGHKLPQLGFGVFKVPQAEAAATVREAIKAGYLSVDTAAIYKNEEGVGAALKEAGSIAVTTKLWNDKRDPEGIKRAFDESRQKLQRDKVDLFLIHWPVQNSDYISAWKTLLTLRAAGHVASVGVSNFTKANLQKIIDATGVAPAVNQIELHPTFQQRELRDFHAEHGIATESWSPLGQGASLKQATIGDIARKYKKTPAQIVLRWHLDLGLMVIPKSSTPSRIAENIDLFDFKLDRDDHDVIAKLDRPDGRIGPDPMTFG